MTNPRRNRERKAARRPPFRDPRPVILIVCEGENTEREYFEGFWHAARNPRVQIHISRKHGVPKTLVEAAKELKKEAQNRAKKQDDENLAIDSVWCVRDVDEHPNLPDAKQMARDNEIYMAISNPCFELWLLLHFRESPGMQHRDKVRQLLKGCVPQYDKHVDYQVYSAGYSQAVIRAQRLDQSAASDGESGRNPTTGVYKLTELIRGERVGESFQE
jgi:hypothetical protein